MRLLSRYCYMQALLYIGAAIYKYCYKSVVLYIQVLLRYCDA